MPPANPDDDFQFALGNAVRMALMHEDAATFLAWMRDYGVRLFLEAMDQRDMPGEMQQALATSLGMELWNHLPRPDNDFKPRKLREPGRNDPCPCGSGRKFKNCCGGMGRPPTPFGEEVLLPIVLGFLSKKDLAALPPRRFSPELLAVTANEWSLNDEPARACLLLEPLFKEPGALDERHADAFDVLMDAYLKLNKPRKRKDLLRACLASASPALRGTARQREAVMLLDAGHAGAAWQAFHEALRENPDDPALAALEISMLQGEDRVDQLQQRARFWLAKLRRRPDAGELGPVIDLLQGVIDDPEAFGEQFMAQSLPELHAFAALLAAAPPIRKPPKLEVTDDGHGILHDALSARLLDDFTAQLEQGGLNLARDWLVKHPAAWDALSVLDQLTGFVEQTYEPMVWSDEHVIAPLCRRAGALLDAALAAAPRAPERLAWGWVENRPAIRLRMRRIATLSRAGDYATAIAEGEQLLAWNPDDNPGARLSLGRLYAYARRWGELLDLCRRHPDADAELRYQEVLALYMLDRKGEALQALHDASRAWPVMLKTLLSVQDKPAAPDRFGVVEGGAYQAWLYREDLLGTWQSSGALEWARGVAPALRRKR
mgnify:CR=1 FL=1